MTTPSRSRARRSPCRSFLLAAASLALVVGSAGAVDFVEFESGPVKTAAMNAGGTPGHEGGAVQSFREEDQ